MRGERNNWKIEAALVFAAAVALAPIALLTLTAFKSENEVLALESLIPREWTLENFRRVLDTPEEVPIGRWFFNSLLIASATTALVLAVSSLAAYVLVRLRPPGSRLIFSIIVGTMMVPGQILLVPLYQILDQLHWIDTPMALVFPGAAGAFGTFMLAQFFRGIPVELEEAAVLDGCGRFGVFRHVVLPLGAPAFATLAIFTFIGSWNNFIAPLVFLDSLRNYTLPVGIALFQSSYAAEYGVTFAASFLSTLPVLAAFLLFQRHIVQSVALTGLK
ncbi:MAG: carbohydrate ABC transporter permease [Opitutaceae bacterium]